MTDFLVRQNLDTGRLLSLCVCGRTVSLPDSGLALHDCPCGRVWDWDGENIAVWTPAAWRCHEMGRD